MFCVPLKIFQFSYFTRCFSFVFIEHCRHFDDFIITTKTFPASSKQMSTIPILDNHSLVPNEPSALALILITWFRSVCLSIFESIWPTVFRYRFTMKASSFRLFSKSSSVTSVKTSVCLLQQVGCTGGCKFIKSTIFLLRNVPFQLNAMARTNILFISKYSPFFGVIAVLSDFLVSHAVVVQENCLTLRSETLAEGFSTISSCPPQFLQPETVFSASFAAHQSKWLWKSSDVSSQFQGCFQSHFSLRIYPDYYHYFHQNSIYIIPLLRTFLTNHLDCSKSLQQTFLRAFFFSLSKGTFLTLLAAFRFLPTIIF